MADLKMPEEGDLIEFPARGPYDAAKSIVTRVDRSTGVVYLADYTGYFDALQRPWRLLRSAEEIRLKEVDLERAEAIARAQAEVLKQTIIEALKETNERLAACESRLADVTQEIVWLREEVRTHG